MRDTIAGVICVIAFLDRGMHECVAVQVSLRERIASAAPPPRCSLLQPHSRAAYRLAHQPRRYVDRNGIQVCLDAKIGAILWPRSGVGLHAHVRPPFSRGLLSD